MKIVSTVVSVTAAWKASPKASECRKEMPARVFFKSRELMLKWKTLRSHLLGQSDAHRAGSKSQRTCLTGSRSSSLFTSLAMFPGAPWCRAYQRLGGLCPRLLRHKQVMRTSYFHVEASVDVVDGLPGLVFEADVLNCFEPMKARCEL